MAAGHVFAAFLDNRLVAEPVAAERSGILTGGWTCDMREVNAGQCFIPAIYAPEAVVTRIGTDHRRRG